MTEKAISEKNDFVILVNPVTGIANVFVHGKIIKVPNPKAKAFIEKIRTAMAEAKLISK